VPAAGGTGTPDELRRGIEFRADALADLLKRLRGPVPESRASLNLALALLEQFPPALTTVVSREWDRTTDDKLRNDVLGLLLRHLNFVASFIESYFSHGTRPELSEALVQEIACELEALGLSEYQIVASHGRADNFETVYGDVEAALFAPLKALMDPLPPDVSGKLWALFQMPRIEGAGIFWRPVLLGHEVAHIAVTRFDGIAAFDLASRFDFTASATIASPLAPPASSGMDKTKALYEIAQAWTKELLCDAHAVFRFGPAAVASLADYHEAIGAMGRPSPTHPPGFLRIRLLLDFVGALTSPRLKALVDPWASRVAPPFAMDPWANALVNLFWQHRDALMEVCATWPTFRYEHQVREPVVLGLADLLLAGIPGHPTITDVDGSTSAALDADIVNAAWVARAEDAEVPIANLGMKAIESLEFTRRWVRNGGPLPFPQESDDEDMTAAVLAERELSTRLLATENALVVTPLLQLPKGAAIDLRLGNRFIVFRRTMIEAFDPLASGSDPRAIQLDIELAWTERFVLHPNELVLGATLEYLVLPEDLSAQVITRSSYGRLGLLSATAVQVHPHFHGCLTLELVNLGTIPISLTPGERIAQLVVSRSGCVPDPGRDKYYCAIGPEFSKVRDDHESDVLRRLRDE